MIRQKLLLTVLVTGVISVLCVGQAMSQEGGRRGRRGGQRDGQRGGEREAQTDEQRAERRAQWQAAVSERFREGVGATEEEWEIILPLIEEVQAISGRLQAGSRSAMYAAWGRRGRRADDAAADDAEAPEPTPLEAATAALKELTEDDTASIEDIRAAMATLRDARADVEAELVVAKDALRGELTALQEAKLILWGILD